MLQKMRFRGLAWGLLAIGLWAATCVPLGAQVPKSLARYLVKRHQATAYQHRGPCRVLHGQVVLLPILVNTPNGSWQPTDELAVQQACTEAAQWLTRQAQQAGLPPGAVSLAVAGPHRAPRTVAYDSLHNQVNNPRLHHLSLGLGRLRGVCRRAAMAYAKGTVVVPLLFVNQKGTSIAYARKRWQFFREYAVVYLDGVGLRRREQLATAVAHEVLHLFGATDLYFPEGLSRHDTTSNAFVARTVFAQEVMYASYGQLNELGLSEVTQYLIGWQAELPAHLRRYLNRKG